MIDYISEFKKIKELQSCPNCNKPLNHVNHKYDYTWKCCSYIYKEYHNEGIFHDYAFSIIISDNIKIYSKYIVNNNTFRCDYIISLNDNDLFVFECNLEITDLLSKSLADLIDETKVMILFS
jgi:ssDNA-binding Zn-finger/Zn-ribbon topoisomerase 1